MRSIAISSDDRPRVVLDTMVLVQRSTHELIGRLGVAGFWDIGWSAALLQEVEDVRQREWGDSPAAARHRTDLVRTAFPESRVDVGEATGATFVNDPNDATVAAVAIGSSPSALVTRDLGGFKVKDLKGLGVDVTTPDALLQSAYRVAPEGVVAALDKQRQTSPGEPGLHDLISRIARCGEGRFAAQVCRDLGLPSPMMTPPLPPAKKAVRQRPTSPKTIV